MRKRKGFKERFHYLRHKECLEICININLTVSCPCCSGMSFQESYHLGSHVRCKNVDELFGRPISDIHRG